MPVLKVVEGRVPVKVWTDQLDLASERQLKNIAALPFVFRHVAAMADVHLGIGATVGSVVATQGAVVPAAVGVDIGCGMAALRLPLRSGDLQGKLAALRAAIEAAIPVGFHGNREISPLVRSWPGWERFGQLHAKALDLRRRAMEQMGSLGGGNHFIELCLDAEDRVWALLHSGSRNLGKSLAEIHIELAKRELKRAMLSLPDPDLAYFKEGTPEFDAYLRDLQFAQDYARHNREIMMARLLGAIGSALGRAEAPQGDLAVNCHHNYAARETHFGRPLIVTRKGAVRAGKGELGIIPGSMGAKSFIVRGKGEPESFESCSHGAGRSMSRREAKRRFTVSDLRRETAGVECRKDEGVLDEIPSAYKPIERVMAQQSDLVEIVAQLKQIVCVKG